MTDLEILKELKKMGDKVNEMERKLERFLLDRHQENADAISTTEEAVLDVASTTAENVESIQNAEEAIMEIASMVSDLTEAVAS